jgi:hypothetical protein
LANRLYKFNDKYKGDTGRCEVVESAFKPPTLQKARGAAPPRMI